MDKNYLPVFGYLIWVIFVISLLGNVTLWIVLLRVKQLRTVGNMLVLNLSAADLLVTLFNMPVTAYGLINENWLPDKTACVILGYFNMITFLGSVIFLSVISINRYLAVCHFTVAASVFTKNKTIIMVALSWLGVFLVSSPPLMGWSVYRYIQNTRICFVDWLQDPNYLIFMAIIGFILPGTTMIITNLLIFLEVKRSANKVASVPETNDRDSRRVAMRKKNEIRLAKSMAIIILAFICTWSMYAVSTDLEVFAGVEIPLLVAILSLLLGYGNSALNPIIYGALNKNVRNGLKDLTCCKIELNRGTSVNQSNNTTHTFTLSQRS